MIPILRPRLGAHGMFGSFNRLLSASSSRVSRRDIKERITPTGTRLLSVSHGEASHSPPSPRRGITAATMSHSKGQTRQSHSPFSADADNKSTLAPARPSSSIILLSPINEVLLLHRVQTSSSFPSAHVFPGGNLSAFHEGEDALPHAPSDPAFHVDSPAYRHAAIRETFEESGILLARAAPTTTTAPAAATVNAPLLIPDPALAEAARRAVHADELRFADWLRCDLGGAAPCVDELVPFTRWVTPPPGVRGRRFTTQMYLYFMPLGASSAEATVHHTPTADGGVEHTAATFARPREWLRRQTAGEIMLFPPQLFLLTMVARAFDACGVREGEGRRERVLRERDALMRFARGDGVQEGTRLTPTARIPWSEKVMCPAVIFRRSGDGRIVLGLDKPGPELKGTGRGGDFERVVLVRFEKEGPRDVEVRNREDVLREEREGEQGDSKL